MVEKLDVQTWKNISLAGMPNFKNGGGGIVITPPFAYVKKEKEHIHRSRDLLKESRFLRPQA